MSAADPAAAVAHLTPEAWRRASRRLLAKAIGEFCHERLLHPRDLGGGRYALATDDGAAEYRFAARRLALEHWQVDEPSIARVGADGDADPDVLAFLRELRGALGLPERMLPVYLEEVGATVASRAYLLHRGSRTAAELAAAGYQEIEAGLAEGHPCFVANSGRVGLDAAEYLRYAPEAAPRVRPVWLAVHTAAAEFSCVDGLDYAELIRGELGPQTLAAFDAVLAGHGLDPAEYLLLPAHPWQWWNKISMTFAADIARRTIVCLGHGDDDYAPQQSVRTLVNLSRPERHSVKTAMSVLNMGFLRGLSADYMRGTPAINDWVARLIADDPELAASGMRILAERAAIGYRSPDFEPAAPRGSPYRKMLAALWRESPVPGLRAGQRLASMAALLHVDAAGASLAGALVAESGLGAAEWLRGYLDAYLRPLLHCMYAHDFAFLPHGENAILVLEGGRVVRVIVKDIAEEVQLMSRDAPLPAEVERIRVDVPDRVEALAILSDVFDCFFRFLAAALDSDGTLGEAEFWACVARCVAEYQREHPELAAAFARLDLFAETFPLSCLNRLQLRDNEQMLDLQDPVAGMQIAGEVANPLAAHRPG